MCGMVAAMLFPVVATCSFSACADNDDETSSFVSPYADSRTVMVYMVAENSLSANVWSDVNEMLVGMKNDSLKVGDRLEINLGGRTLAVEVLQVAETVRKDDASAMYKEV